MTVPLRVSYLVGILGLFLSYACSTSSRTTQEHTIAENDSLVALQFVNDYVQNCIKEAPTDVLTWVNARTDVTDRFKSTLVQLLNVANSADPEIGLGFDPIFDAQDFPEEGFELDPTPHNDLLEADTTGSKPLTRRIILRGKQWQDYLLTVQLIKSEKGWLIDGCGVIEPEDN